MRLSVCKHCHRHSIESEPCPYCLESSRFTLPFSMAFILGIGCNHETVEPTPEIMALYGAPPTELQDFDLKTEDTAKSEPNNKNNPKQLESATENSDASIESDVAGSTEPMRRQTE